MTRTQFNALFRGAIDEAIAAAQKVIQRAVPPTILVELHSLHVHGELVSASRALDEIYLDEMRFFKIVDIGFKGIDHDKCVVFVRVSGHSPGPFSETWDPTRFGPFKIIEIGKFAQQ